MGQGGQGTFAPFVPCRGRAGAAPCCGASPRRANRGGRSWAAAREQRPARGSLCSPVKNQPEARRHKFTTCLMPVRTLYMEKLQRSIFFFHHVMLYTQQRHKVADSGRTPRLSLPAQLSTCRSHTHTAQARRLCSFAHATPRSTPQPAAGVTHTATSTPRAHQAEREAQVGSRGAQLEAGAQAATSSSGGPRAACAEHTAPSPGGNHAVTTSSSVGAPQNPQPHPVPPPGTNQ